MCTDKIVFMTGLKLRSAAEASAAKAAFRRKETFGRSRGSVASVLGGS